MPDVPPHAWRADWGYLPPLGDTPYPMYGPPPGGFFAYSPPPPLMVAAPVPVMAPPSIAISGPPILGPPPPYSAGPPPPPPPPPPAAPAPAPAPHAPDIPGTTVKGGRRAGTNYLFPTKHTKLHVIKWDGPGTFWERSPGAGDWTFSIQTVACGMSVKNIIESLGGKDDMVLTEVVELGGDKWSKGVTIKFKEDKAGKPITSWGWGEGRGEGLPPVWVVLHKA